MSSEHPPHPERAPRREWLVLLAVFLVGFLILLSRKPDFLFNPQFYIEDGRDWFRQAHEFGALRALPIQHRGYFVLVQRIGASLAVALPLAWAPLAMGLLAAVVNILPAVFVASSRFASVVPSLGWRLLLAFLCLAQPNAWTLTTSMTNSMWYLGVLACMVVLAAPSQKRSWRVFDLGVVIVSGLSGPFSVMLAPIAALKWWFRRERWSLVLMITTATVSLVQVACILLTPKPPEGIMEHGATAYKFGRLVVNRVMYESLFGQVGGQMIENHLWGDFWTNGPVLVVVGLAGLALLVYAMLKAPLELRLFVVYALLIFFASIIWAGSKVTESTWWDILVPAGNGNRYFLVPVWASLFTYVWMASARPRFVRGLGVCLLAVAFAFGIRMNWREPPFRDFEYPSAVRRYKAAPVGEKVLITHPPGWDMVITKKEGEPVVVEPDECTGDRPVPTKLLASNQLAWQGGVGRAIGGDPYGVYGLPASEYACGVRVTFVLTGPSTVPILFQTFWADSATGDFSQEGSSCVLITPGPEPQTVIFHPRTTIDRIRLDPGSDEGVAFELQEIVLLTQARSGRS